MGRFRWIAACLAALLLLPCCAAEPAGEEEGVLFYYQDAAPDYGAPDGVLGSERRSFPAGVPTFVEFLNAYFGQPRDPSLRSPFPKDLRCLDAALEDGVLTVRLSRELDDLSGLDRSIAAACITRTVTQFDGVTGVRLETEKSAEGEPAFFTPQDFVCEERGADNTETAVRLYFSDVNGRYLVSAERKSYFADPAAIPAYVVQQLIEGPTEEGQLAVMPEGTALRGLTVGEDGECVVDLSSEFYLNRPTSELMERMTVLSLVNSLTELDGVRSVRLLVEGKKVEQYLRMDLDRALVRDESAIDVVRAGRNEVDATLYVRGWREGELAAVPVSVRETAQFSLPEALLEALLAFQGVNGMGNPLPEGVLVQRVEQENGICYVDLSERLLECAGDAAAETMAIRAVTATLTSLDSVSVVKISVDGRYTGFQYMPLDRLYRPEDGWFA